MSRRPAARRPPKLPPPGGEPAARIGPRAEPTLRQLLVQARVAGRTRLGRSELLATARRVARGDPDTLLELEPYGGLGLDDVLEVATARWGLGEETAVSIDPDRTLAGAVAGFGRVADVAHRGGRVAFATTRPASLLPLYQTLAAHARAAGAVILEADETGPARIDGRSGRRLWWLAGVAVVTDGAGLLAGPGRGAAAELLFELPRPDLLVADRALAGAGVADDLEIVAPAGLDAIALAVAAARGTPLSLVPLDDTRPAAAYAPLERLAADVFASAS